MGTLDSLLLFCSTYAQVFLLGFQSKNVHASRYLLAGITSFMIGVTSYFFVRYAADHGGLQFIFVSGIGGSLGIMSAIWTHDKWMPEKKNVEATNEG